MSQIRSGYKLDDTLYTQFKINLIMNEITQETKI